MTLVVGTVYFLYWGFCVVVSLASKPKENTKSAKPKKICVLCSARNEENVIGELIDSVKSQDYPQECVDIWIISDNSTDKTKEVAERHGAKVLERFNKEEVGKGYALKYFFDYLTKNNKHQQYDYFLVFDADNTLERDYLKLMNDMASEGYDVVTSYRNSHNAQDNWISANHSFWFIRESRMLNQARQKLGLNCHIGGTGFMFTKELMLENNGWKHFLLTEDLEFTMDCILHGKKIGYQKDAIFYDEQPISMKQSFTQRTRWCKGFLQVFRYYGADLLKRAFQKHDFSCIDLSLLIFPWIFMIIVRQVVGFFYVILNFVPWQAQIESLANVFGGYLAGVIFLFVLTIITIIVERNRINMSTKNMFKNVITFPIYSITFLPTALFALFSKPQWKPIVHGQSRAKILMSEQTITSLKTHKKTQQK